MGEISLRRRLEPTLQIDVYEAMLGEEHLMSSLFTVAEIALADLALAEVAGDELDVVVGGLGLGYTALAALRDVRVRSVHVVEALSEVIGWHEQHLVPLGAELTGDPRCHLRQGDFFALVASGAPLAGAAHPLVNAVLLDVDHTPHHVLHPSHAPFYEPRGLALLADQLHPGGVFGLWSDDPPDDSFLGSLAEVFATTAAHVVPFPNHHTGETASNTVYVATVAG
jgi:spermidine synthase